MKPRPGIQSVRSRGGRCRIAGAGCSAERQTSWSEPALLFLVGLGAVASARPVRFPGLRIEMIPALPVILIALGALGPMAAALIGLAGVVASGGGRGRLPVPIRFVFNLGAVTLSTAAAAGRVRPCRGTPRARAGVHDPAPGCRYQPLCSSPIRGSMSGAPRAREAPGLSSSLGGHRYRGAPLPICERAGARRRRARGGLTTLPYGRWCLASPCAGC